MRTTQRGTEVVPVCRPPGMAPKLSDSVEELSATGNQSFRNGQYAEASALYERALRLLQARGRNPPLVSPLGLQTSCICIGVPGLMLTRSSGSFFSRGQTTQQPLPPRSCIFSTLASYEKLGSFACFLTALLRPSCDP